VKLSTALLSFLLFALIPGLARAETQYVTDELTITLRSGQDSSYRVIKALPSGTELEVLSTNEDTGYSRIRTPDGTEGYSLTRFLTTEVPAQVELVRVKEELEQLRQQQSEDDVQQALNELRGQYQDLKLRYDTLEFENVQLSQRMEAVRENASNVVELMDERDAALQRANRVSTELEELRVRNTELENHGDKKWFMAGAGVLALGIIVGIILPRVSVRRRSRWGGSGDFSL